VSISRDILAGLVLTGGKSQRMRRDKATLVVGERSLWRMAADVLASQVDTVYLVGAVASLNNTDPYRLLPDDPPGFGPLGGIATGLEQSGYTHHLVLAVDYPLIRHELLQLIGDRATGVQAVCGRSHEFLEPLVAYYHADCAAVIRRMLAEGEIRTHKLYERVRSHILNDEEYDSVDPDRLSQFNVNTPDDLERVRVRWAAQNTQQRPLENR